MTNNGKAKKIAAAAAALAVIAALAALAAGGRGGKEDDEPLFTVARGRLDIMVSAPGTVRSRNSAVVKCEAQGRNTVVWVIDEGRIVTNGQLLVELDSGDFEKQLTDQLIVVGNSEAALAQAKERLAIAEIDRESSVADAELGLMLSKLESEKYVSGEYPQSLQESESKIALAREEVERAAEKLDWTRRLAAEGFVTRSDLQADELSLKQKQANLVSAETSLNVLTNYSHRQQLAKLQADVEQAERNVDKTRRQTNASVAQAESELAAKEQENARQLEKKANLEEQIRACRIFSPAEGMVVYASTLQASRRRWGVDPLAAGAAVVTRQELIHIPVEGGLVVEFSVPESDMTKLAVGQQAEIGIDALPDLVLSGGVSKIGLLPDGHNAWLNPDMNLYNCELAISNAPPGTLRAGMNCTVKMLAASYDNVLSVPLQCVMRTGGESFVFVATEQGGGERRRVSLGADNGRFVMVEDGLAEGDAVLLAPPLSAGEAEPAPKPGP